MDCVSDVMAVIVLSCMKKGICGEPLWYLFIYIYSKKANPSADQERKQLAEFLEPMSLSIYPLVAGKLPLLSKLPPRTDIHEWLATNCESKVFY